MAPLSLTFDEVAEVYDSVRPGYPDELIDTVDAALGGTTDRVLEIGCGTGQATLPLARRGRTIVALEPGPRLAAMARQKLDGFPAVQIRETTFEEWPMHDGRFDMVLCATAFHWVLPQVRYTKSASALDDGGWLTLFWNVEGEDDTDVARRIQAVYDAHMPRENPHPYATHHPASGVRKGLKTSRWTDEIDASGLFGPVEVTEFRWSQWYPTEQYLQLLQTYSDHRAMPSDDRQRLFDGIAGVLEDAGGGRQKSYLSVLYMAQKGPTQQSR